MIKPTTPRPPGAFSASINSAVLRQRKTRGAAPNRGPKQPVHGGTSISTPPTRANPG